MLRCIGLLHLLRSILFCLGRPFDVETLSTHREGRADGSTISRWGLGPPGVLFGLPHLVLDPSRNASRFLPAMTRFSAARVDTGVSLQRRLGGLTRETVPRLVRVGTDRAVAGLGGPVEPDPSR